MTCALCLGSDPLVEGHVLFPRFYFKRMRKEGGGLVRNLAKPNKSQQDGPKAQFLCGRCEAAFNRRETEFANVIFHPWLDRGKHPTETTVATHYFLVSLLWRSLRIHMGSPGREAALWLPRLEAVQEDWRQYLNGAKEMPACDEVHMMHLDVARPGRQPVRNLNRYMVVTCDSAVGASPTRCFLYSKMGMFLTVGWISGFKAELWENTHVPCSHAPSRPPPRILDEEMVDFIVDRARVSHEQYHAAVSERQQDKDLARTMKNIERLRLGLFGRARAADLAATVDPMIGRKAKIQRNEKCPCGSGRKYKHCHWGQ